MFHIVCHQDMQIKMTYHCALEEPKSGTLTTSNSQLEYGIELSIILMGMKNGTMYL